MSNSISRSVDLTQQLIFNKNKGREKPIEKRYHKIENKQQFSQTTSAVSTNIIDDFEFNGFRIMGTNATTTFGNRTINPFPFINYIEEKIPWRKLRNEGDCFCEGHTVEEWEEIYRHYNFPMGTKEQRYETIRKRNKKIQEQLMYENVCECCGVKFKSIKIPWKIKQPTYYGLCERCSKRYIHKIPWKRGQIDINKRIAWR